MSRPAAAIVSPAAIAKQVKTRLYGGDKIPVADKVVTGHLFVCACDWYITEYDPNEDMAFGFCHIGNDQGAEWGYVSIAELRQARYRGVFRPEWDRYWDAKKASEIEKIVRCGGC